MKSSFLDLMEKTLSAYSTESIEQYFARVKRDGLTEHGFGRLTANIGILIANGRRTDLKGLFVQMMDFCCESIPKVKAANDFTVREIVCCIEETERSGAFESAQTERWKDGMRKVQPYDCYNETAKSVDDRVKNWVLFTGVSEFFRYTAGLGGDMEFIETQIGSQLKWLDENGMYMDNGEEKAQHPMVYDAVPRGLFSLLLWRGYRGKYFAEIDAALIKAGLMTLGMQSVNGELAFGGRSNQFLHNEPWIAMICLYEAARYARQGDEEKRRLFVSAAGRALAVTEEWLSKTPIRHLKNRYATETGYGCEGYAYFDKYMITTASFLYTAMLVADDEPVDLGDEKDGVVATSEHFHKLFVKKSGYFLEFDLNADPHYDACGLGRVHKKGAPGTVCLSVPCPAEPSYKADGESNSLSVCVGARGADGLEFALDGKSAYRVTGVNETDRGTAVELACTLEGRQIIGRYGVSADGVEITVSGEGGVALMLPVFDFDGENSTCVSASERSVSVSYGGWTCRYETDGVITDLGYTAFNRNGRYRAYCAEGKSTLRTIITIDKEKKNETVSR